MRGRPKQEYNLDHFVGVRLGDKDKNILEYLCEDLDADQSEVIRRALRYYYFANGGGRN